MDHSANSGCKNCESSPYEQISFPGRPAGVYYFWVVDAGCPAPTICPSGLRQVQIQVFENGTLFDSVLVNMSCDMTGQRFGYCTGAC